VNKSRKKAAAKAVKFANAQRTRAVVERRRSNAPGIMEDKRTKRNRDRSAQQRNAIREQVV